METGVTLFLEEKFQRGNGVTNHGDTSTFSKPETTQVLTQIIISWELRSFENPQIMPISSKIIPPSVTAEFQDGPFHNVRVPFPKIREPFPNVRVPFLNVREHFYLGL